MAGRVSGKIAIVTGAGSSGHGVGIGAAISIVLAREGASVLLVDRVTERAGETRRLIEEAGGRAELFTGDIGNPQDCEAMVQHAVDRFGRLDMLVNNAAISEHVSILDAPPELLERAISVNLTGSFMACKFAIPVLIGGGGGSIINIGSIASVRDTGSSHPAYSATKAALLGLTVDLAGAYGRDNIRVNTVLPGIIDSPMLRAVAAERSTDTKSLDGVNLLWRKGSTWDIANAVLFLCSDEAAYITGVVLPVDGGAVMAMPSSRLLRMGA